MEGLVLCHRTTYRLAKQLIRTVVLISFGVFLLLATLLLYIHFGQHVGVKVGLACDTCSGVVYLVVVVYVLVQVWRTKR
jgi:hypothetical protein